MDEKHHSPNNDLKTHILERVILSFYQFRSLEDIITYIIVIDIKPKLNPPENSMIIKFFLHLTAITFQTFTKDGKYLFYESYFTFNLDIQNLIEYQTIQICPTSGQGSFPIAFGIIFFLIS